MSSLKLSVNTSIYDGYDIETTLSSIKKCGFNFFELAYNQGYVGNLTQQLFSQQHADEINQLKNKYQLDTYALGCTMDLSVENFYEIFSPRIYFAHAIGAKFLNVCTCKAENKAELIKNLKSIQPILSETGCILCLENGGDKNFNAFITLEDGLDILQQLDDEHYSINFDAGNMVTYDKSLDVITQSISAIEHSKHFHLKDVKVINDQFHFPAITGEGLISYDKIIPQLIKQDIPCGIEIPLRMYRKADATPIRQEEPIDLNIIENTLLSSRQYIQQHLI
ncbi:sugar phosphate isomerase/epimerase family protein [Lonepinella sp. BR2271]|uniref:sugar phosphate isomerase/epimerase family protein n=1 Tax=Lonepinella sp. BR2271 TaxID=3434550 RepID=UPI003F6DF4AA